MLNASRCSLLSRSLPSYQQAALEFFDSASHELQTVLNNFKSCHYHQYKIKSEEQEEEEESSKELKSFFATIHISKSENDIENSQPLVDLTLSDDQAAQIKEGESKVAPKAYYVDSSYQAVDTFSQFKTVQLESINKQVPLEPSSDSLASPTDDTVWSKLSSEQAASDGATADLSLLEINPSVPLVSSTITSPVTPATSSSTASILHSLNDLTSPKLRDNWDDLFADLDPLSNEKV